MKDIFIMKKEYLICFMAIAATLLCGKKNVPTSVVPVVDVEGKAAVMLSSGQTLDAIKGMEVPAGSRISVAAGSRIILGSPPFKSIAAIEHTQFSIDSITGSGGEAVFVLGISRGRIFCSARASVATEELGIRMLDPNTAMTVAAGDDGRSAVVKTIGGPAAIEFGSKQRMVVPSCCKAIIRGQGGSNAPMPLTKKDFEGIVSFLGKQLADSVIDNALCPQSLQSEQNAPPQWEKTPNRECPAGREFFDTLFARDPEGSIVTYALIDGPQGMIVDSLSGVLRFFPKRPATHPLRVAATTSSNITAHMAYDLVVNAAPPAPQKASPGAVIDLPGTGTVGETVRIDASHSARSTDQLKNLAFRFDVNGDGSWDYPGNGAFGPSPAVTHAFNKEGTFTVLVQVKNADGRIAAAKNRIVVHRKPEAKITVYPDTVREKQPCMLDASKSTASACSSSLAVRWDLDNNGTWDYPEGGGFTAEKTVKKAWMDAGRHCVVAEIKDCFGTLAWASAEVTVRPASAPSRPVSAAPAGPNKPAMVKAGGLYQAEVNSPVAFEGSAHDPDNALARYCWDFQGDGVFDTTAPSGKAVHAFSKPGTYRAVFKAVTDDSLQWFDTATVMILNSPPIAHAGTDVFSVKGRNVTLKGVGEDSDDRIVRFEWDLDGNGSFDWSSPKSGKVKHVFDEYCFPVLRVTDENGATGYDTLRVVICPDGMTGVQSGPFCIDLYEWPNAAGKEPLRDVPFLDAREKCRSAGKRLCSAGEWEAACAGSRGVQFPKSASPPQQNCNVAGNRFYANRVAPSGSFSDCKSPCGAMDMNGNVDEWTDGGGGDSAYVYGGSWHHDIQNAQCSSKLPLSKNRGYFYVGFRCCK
jgi:PKD repeat protein